MLAHESDWFQNILSIRFCDLTVHQHFIENKMCFLNVEHDLMNCFEIRRKIKRRNWTLTSNSHCRRSINKRKFWDTRARNRNLQRFQSTDRAFQPNYESILEFPTHSMIIHQRKSSWSRINDIVYLCVVIAQSNDEKQRGISPIDDFVRSIFDERALNQTKNNCE